jgi:hypothetical protein
MGLIVLLSVAILGTAIIFKDDPEDVYINQSVWSEVYMPDKHGVGIIAKKNISVGSRQSILDLAQYFQFSRERF